MSCSVVWVGDDPLIIENDGTPLAAVIYDSDSLQGLSERCLHRLAELTTDGLEWTEAAEILIDEGYHNVYPDKQASDQIKTAIAELNRVLESASQIDTTKIIEAFAKINDTAARAQGLLTRQPENRDRPPTP